MKRGKNPNRKQKITIRQAKLKPENWLVVKNPPGELHIIHRSGKSTKILKSS